MSVSQRIVSKFGGTSMGNLAAMKRSAEISIERGSAMVVVSATSGTTDKLIQIAKTASLGETQSCLSLVQEVKTKHTDLFNETQKRSQTFDQLHQLFTELDLLVQNISLLKELTPKAFDHIQSLGERMSSLIFRDVFESLCPTKKIELIDARHFIKTDSNFGKATPHLTFIHQQCEKNLSFDGKTVYITQGFIGSDLDGNTTVLGRGGSDYSAALFAEGVRADILEIWTDVPGVATTDPRITKKAKIIHELSYAEAAEMAQYGAKILHPATIAPAVRQKIPVFVGSTFDKDLPGTWIRESVDFRPHFRAITKRNSQALLTITTPNMFNAYGFMSEIFNVFEQHRISVDCVTTSEISVAITVDQTTIENKSFIEALKKVGSIEIESGYSLVSLIGNELNRTPNLATQIFENIQSTNIRMMSLGASSYNFNFLVHEQDANPCIEKLHSALIEAQ